MSDDQTTTVKRLKGGRIECTVTFHEAEITPAEEKALHELSRDIEMPGFRKGSVPMDMVREKVDPQKLFEKTIHNLLPPTFEQLVKEHDIKPVVHPKVEAESREPLILKITFIEKPEVTLKGINKITVEKKDIKLDEKDVQKMIEYILDKHKKFEEVDHPVEEGNQVTMDFYGEDGDQKEIEGIRTEGHQVEVGSKVLIPGFEDNLIGMKKGEKKQFNLTFPEKYHAEHLQGMPGTFHVTIQKIETVQRPELTDAFAKAELHSNDAADFKNQIEESMKQQEEMMERQRRERALMDAIADATHVDLAPELLEDEARQLLTELVEQLQQQGIALEDWIKQTGKSVDDIQKDMEQQGERRLKLRLGMTKLVDEKNIEISDDEMEQIVEEFLSQAPPEQRKAVEESYQKGANAWEQLKWQKKVERVLEEMLG